MKNVLVDPSYAVGEFAAELAALDAAGLLIAPPDPEATGGPVEVGEVDWFDTTAYKPSRVESLEWEQWAGADQDDAERALLAARAPDWVSLPPGGDLAAALEQVRPQTESPIALIELMKAATRMASWAEAIKLSAIASFERQRRAQAAEIPRPGGIDAHGRPVDPQRSRAAEIACALRLSPTTVHRHIDTALRLTSDLTATHTALRCGALTLSKALSIVDATSALTAEQARTVEAHVLKRAAGQTHANLRASLRRQVAKIDTRGGAARHRAAVAERRCRVVPLADGMAGLWLVHTADKIQQLYVVIKAMADLAKHPHTGDTTPGTSNHNPDNANDNTDGDGGSGGDEPTAAHRRADVTADLFEHMLHNGLDWLNRRLPDQHKRRPHIEVTIAANTLLGLDNNPAELTGYGPIPADLARRIAADGTWRRLLTDPVNGTVLEASTTRHDPGLLVSETLLARYPTCVWPGCNHPARECDRDHTTPYNKTGRTRLGGLGVYCEYHHVIKDTPAWGWHATNNPDGSITLTSPTGHRYTTVPPARGPISRPTPPPHAQPADPPF